MNILGFVLIPFAIFAALVLAFILIILAFILALSIVELVFEKWVLAMLFIILAAFVAIGILFTIWRLLYYLIHPIYDKWRDLVSDCIN